jgi:hypothetical protein
MNADGRRSMSRRSQRSMLITGAIGLVLTVSWAIALATGFVSGDRTAPGIVWLVFGVVLLFEGSSGFTGEHAF